MFGLTGRQVRELQGAGGEAFTAFVDALIRAHCAVHGIADADVATNIRTTIPDGGVDTTVRAAVAYDPAGWLAAGPTVWQYKGGEYRNVTVGNLLDGDAVQERIQEGHAFRLAIADSMPGDTRGDWEATLTRKAREIRADAHEARIVTADDLAAWTTRYPGLVLRRFRPELLQLVLHLNAWSRNALHSTPEYVPVSQWQAIAEGLVRHLDFTAVPPHAVALLQGEAGVGKTRLTYEVARAVPGASALVLYCPSGEAAVKVAVELANEEATRAVLIADETGINSRMRIEGILAGHGERVRAIAIDNTGVRALGVQPEHLLRKMPGDTLNAVLDANFPHVTPERRRAYAVLADGFPRLAARLCMDDPLIAAAGHVGPAVPAVGDYLRICLSPHQLEALAALALVTKVGYAGAVRSQLDDLCAMLDLQRADVERHLHAIHDGPGFVARTERYFYVTPELVAQVAYEDAWRRWGRDADAFFGRVPDQLVQAVLDRAWRSAPGEVRRACAAYFRNWADTATPQALGDVAAVRRLVALADTHPGQYLPHIRRLVIAAAVQTLQNVRGEGPGDGTWGPRRSLVWLAERLVQFPEFFDDAEQVLLRLAIAESEPDIANNATGIWCQLFRVYLSGTAVPFDDRLALLRKRIRDENPAARGLALTALEGVFEYHVTRMLGPAVVAGRLPPTDWRPTSPDEERGAFFSALALLSEAVQMEDLRTPALRIAIDNSRWFITRGFFTELRALISTVALTDEELARLVERLDTTLAYDAPTEPGVAELEQWRNSLVSRDLHTRLVATIGKDRWASSRVHAEIARGQSRDSVGPFQHEVNELAEQLLGDQEALTEELPWLTSETARSAADLGEALGRLDEGGAYIEVVLEATTVGASSLFGRGYVFGLLSAHPKHADTVNRCLDAAEEQMPTKAAELAMGGGEITRPIERVLRMFDAGRLPATYLADHNFRVGSEGVSPDNLAALLERLADAAERGDDLARRVGIDAFAARLPYDVPEEPAALFVDNPILNRLAWRLLESEAPVGRLTSHWWLPLVVTLGRLEAVRAAHLAASAVVSDDFHAQEEGEKALAALASSHPAEVMVALGAAMLDEQRGWHFYIGEHRELVMSLPEDIVRGWLENAGVEGARRIARHLPAPHLASDGAPIVPPLTHWVLERFESDDRVFREFCAGVHSFQVYRGDIAGEHEAEAELARRFLDHPLRRVREWAAAEERSALAEAREMRRWEEERDLP